MTRSRAAAGVVLVAGVLLSLAGCAAGPAEPVETPSAFLDREELPSCGELELAPGEEIPAESLTCLEDAGDEGAELAVTRPTTEGDPVTEYYRVLPGGGWEAFIDGSQDRNGGIWWYTDCPDAEAIEDLAACEGAAL
jgi:hypothetical protein